MKLFMALAALVVSAQALPTDMGKADNATLLSARSERSFGFAGYGGGTRGGTGGSTWTVWDAWALRDAVSGNAARIIYVRGRIDLGVLFTKSPGVVLDVGSWKTIIGGDQNAEITGGGLRIKNNQQVIIQNIKFKNAISYAPGEKPNGNGGIDNMANVEFTEVDSILCEGAEYVWIDHCEFSDEPWFGATSPPNKLRHDGLVDIKRGSNWITVSHSIFQRHNKVCLIGHSDKNGPQDYGKLKTSFIGNWFMGTHQRNPRVRFGDVHVLNNLYTDIGLYGIGVGHGSSIFAERNVFTNSRAWRYTEGSTTMGDLRNEANHLISGSYFDNSVTSNVSWHPSNYYNYQSQPIGNVEAYVRNTAGVW